MKFIRKTTTPIVSRRIFNRNVLFFFSFVTIFDLKKKVAEKAIGIDFYPHIPSISIRKLFIVLSIVSCKFQWNGKKKKNNNKFVLVPR